MTALQRRINRTTGVNRNSGSARVNRNRIMQTLIDRGYRRVDNDTLRPSSGRGSSNS